MEGSPEVNAGLSASSLLMVGYVAAMVTKGDEGKAKEWLDINAPDWRLPNRPDAEHVTIG